MLTIAQLKAILPQCGRVEWIGLSPHRRGTIQAVQAAEARLGTGLVGDHHASGGASKREVTLIQAEHLPVIAALSSHGAVPPEWLRRNIVVAGIPLAALKDRTFRVGNVLLKCTGPCDPCSRMEEQLGPGGYNAMRGLGGITACVLEGGMIQIGDDVRVAEDSSATLRR